MSNNSKTGGTEDTAASATASSANAGEIDEFQIRLWFMKVDLEQARDTFRVVEGIIQTREQFQPKRKTRSDAVSRRDAKQAEQILKDNRIPLRELGK